MNPPRTAEGRRLALVIGGEAYETQEEVDRIIRRIEVEARRDALAALRARVENMQRVLYSHEWDDAVYRRAVLGAIDALVNLDELAATDGSPPSIANGR